ncbi:MAG: carbonic anhydrase [Chitinophagales bacterium]|nr:carbonic anhydrase [Chitinophagales bacterium]
MKQSYMRLIEGNATWAAEKLKMDPEYFRNQAKEQKPEFLWIGCSDSRVPDIEITHTQPGEIFTHRNIANMVVHSDFNCMSVLQYGVEVLKVKHIIVCGHYGCGGVLTAMQNNYHGLVNKWLRYIKDVYAKNSQELEAIEDHKQRADRLVELNVIEQVHNLAKTSIVQKAWKNRSLQIHGWVYGMDTGLIKDLNCMMDELNDLEPIFRYNFDNVPEMQR